MSAFGGKADIQFDRAAAEHPLFQGLVGLRNEAFFIARSLRRLRRPLGGQGLQFPSAVAVKNWAVTFSSSWRYFPAAVWVLPRGCSRSKGSMNMQPQLFVWNQCGPCEIKARGPRGG
jgi:hypothetical protein